MNESNPSQPTDYDTAPPPAPAPPLDVGAYARPQPTIAPPPPESAAAAAFGYATAVPNYDGPPPTKDEQNMSLLMFILGIFTGFLGPLILWLVKKAESRFLDVQGKEVLNFQITVIIALLNIPLWFIVIGVLIHFAVVITYLVLMILGAVKASKGIFHRFPFALRLLK